MDVASNGFTLSQKRKRVTVSKWGSTPEPSKIL